MGSITLIARRREAEAHDTGAPDPRKRPLLKHEIFARIASEEPRSPRALDS